MTSDAIDAIQAIFEANGSEAYLGEPVSQSEHALQAAFAAERAGAPRHLVAAALLHDFGHLVHDLPEDCADVGIDSLHEDVGAAWLGRLFGADVTEPMRLHVAAKRYLCAVEPEYLALLSPASRQSLELQGGPLDPGGIAAFERNAHWHDALTLRRFDDMAKVPGLATPTFDHYRPLLESLVARVRSA
jgi:gamma-butyrobetaine dioxygenase